MEIRLPSGVAIGDGQPVFVIAEIGSNFRTLEDCLYSIRQAKGCGASAVKFQAYTREALYGVKQYTALTPEAWDGGPTFVDRPMPGTLPLDWLPKLKYECDKVGVEFMCSAFSPDLLKAVDPYVSLHKIASAELTHVRLLEAARECGKPVILSTGASGEADIGNALNVLGHSGGGYIPPAEHFPTPTVLMYCVAAYPAKEINTAIILHLKQTFGCLAGYSDHSLDALIIPRTAVEQGACVLEKHVTFISDDTPDSPHSLSGDQFRKMVGFIRHGSLPTIGPTPEELPMILRHNRRLIATQDIAAGVTLQEGVNFGIYRSLKDDTKALSPWLIDQVNGRMAKGRIKMGDGIGPQDIE